MKHLQVLLHDRFLPFATTVRPLRWRLSGYSGELSPDGQGAQDEFSDLSCARRWGFDV
jgi:hypothetical protein